MKRITLHVAFAVFTTAFILSFVLLSDFCGPKDEYIPISPNAKQECCIVAEATVRRAIDADAFNDTKIEGIESVSALYNTVEELIGYCVNFKPTGYAIIDVYSYAPAVLSPSNETPFPEIDESGSVKYIYCGVLNYFTLDENGIMTDLYSGEKFPIGKNELKHPYRFKASADLREERLAYAIAYFSAHPKD